jgi:hypothetical protein
MKSEALQTVTVRWISGYQTLDYEEQDDVGCEPLQLGGSSPTFGRNV